MVRIILAALAVSSLATAGAHAADKPFGRQCFLNSQYRGFKALNDHAFILRTNTRDYYRIDLQESCPNLMRPDAQLVTQTRGGDRICDSRDWDLRVAEAGERRFAQACIVKSQHRLTPAEVQAVPPGRLP